LLGSAVVQSDGTYTVDITVPASLASGDHTTEIQGFVTSTSITSFQVGVVVNNTSNVRVVPTITFTSSLPANPVVGDSYNLSASAPSGTVTFSLDATSSGCSLSGSTVRFTSVGTCVIDANAPGSTLYFTNTKSVSFDVVSPVSAPTGVTTVAGDSEVAVSWSPSENAAGFGSVLYTVTASPGGATCSTSTDTCVVTGLTDGVNYTFIVAAASSGPASTATSSSSGVATPLAKVKTKTGATMTLTLARFAAGSSTLTTLMKTQLATFASKMILDGVKSITVTGFSDNQGSKAADLAAGQRRANAVARFLRQELKTIGTTKPVVVRATTLGEAKPIASNATAAGRSANRRAVVVATLN
jgi:outer membrane protein OmpA-like peptidoglycan-associated protein